MDFLKTYSMSDRANFNNKKSYYKLRMEETSDLNKLPTKVVECEE